MSVYYPNPGIISCKDHVSGHCTKDKPHAVFLVGITGAGKSFVANQRYGGRGYLFIDPDRYLHEYPGYVESEPESVEKAHEATKYKAKEDFELALVSQINFVFDSTGRLEKLRSGIGRARDAGFCITLLYVCATLDCALARNRARPRRVSDAIVIQKSTEVEVNFEKASTMADQVIVVDNTRHCPEAVGKNPFSIRPHCGCEKTNPIEYDPKLLFNHNKVLSESKESKRQTKGEQRPSILWAEIKHAKPGQVFHTKNILPKSFGYDDHSCLFVGSARNVPINKLIASEDMGSKEDSDTREYIHLMVKGSEPPPIQVIAMKDGRYIIVNGHHRVLASEMLDRDQIFAVVWKRVTGSCKW